ncbi:aldo/keto reductase [Anaerolentibacter hominis]|uniref:aldo/keto reductase n=1 Tax=Anaerolentibacter hominis TaxID=3079009 RepID=UPI0031B84437
MKKLGFGLMRLPLKEADNKASIDQEQFNQMVDYYMAHGFTYFDTAYPYHLGTSEEAARKAIVERYPRDAYTLTDKMPTFSVTSSEDYPRIFDEQLKRCGVDYFDYYLLHNLGEKNYKDTLKYGGFEFMKQLKAEGKVKHIGFSYHDNARLLEQILTDHPEMEYVQLQINYIDWESESIESRKCYETAVRFGKPVIVMEPVKGGSLANVPERVEKLFRTAHPDMSPASWAVRYAASLDNVFVVLSGMSSLEQLKDNVGYMEEFQPLNEAENSILDQAVEIINGSIVVPCTACRYCVEGCPQEIPIPEFFSLYNNQYQFGHLPAHNSYYLNLTQNKGKASDCIACRQCEGHCPQHIGIVEALTRVAAEFDQ